MIHRTNRHIIPAVILCGLLILGVSAQTTEFTFQGKLTDQNAAANGSYDLSFKLYDAANIQVGTEVVREDVQVANGMFTTSLDFGGSAFDGSARQIEISVRPGASTGSFTALSPKQAINSVPYAVVSKKATTADTATNATQLAGVNASEYVQTNDSRLTDARNPLPGSGSYIRNDSIQQSANFHVLGVGEVGRLGVGVTPTSYKMEVVDPSSRALRVLANTGGGTVASFGALGEFHVDAQNFPGGRLKIKENGNVGIGTSDPQTRFEVHGNIRASANDLPRFSIHYTGTANADQHKWQMYTNGPALNFSAINDTETAETVWMQVTRSSGINLNRVVFPNSVVALDVLGVSGGNALCLNSLNQIARCSSSIRYKENIVDYGSGLDLIGRLRPVSFKWKSDGKADLGLVAEEVAAIDPLLATYNEKGEIEGVKYDRVGVVLVNAVKEQQTQIEAQAATIARQQKQIDALTRLACSTNAEAEICREKGGPR